MNAIDPDGRKIVFVNGYLGFGSPQGGSTYWGGTNSSFVKGAQTFFNDNSTPFFTDHKYSKVQSLFPSMIYSDGYNYAKENYSQLISGMDPLKDVFRIVSHSMGGSFSEGMIKYLKEQGWSVDVAVHLNAWFPQLLKTSDKTITVDATVTNDWIQGLSIQYGDNRIPNANYKVRKWSDNSWEYIHRDLIDNGDIWNTNSNITWNQAMSLLQSWLQQNPNIKVSYGQ